VLAPALEFPSKSVPDLYSSFQLRN